MPQSTGVRHADEPQPGSDQHPEASVDCRLHQEIAAEAASGIVQPLGRSLEITRTSKSNEAVAKVFALQQKEDHEDYNDSCCGQWLNQWADDGLYDLQRRRVGLVDLDRDRRLRLSRHAAPRSPLLSALLSSGGVVLVISLLRSLKIPEARPKIPLPVAEPRNEWILSVIFVWYCGRFSARWASCPPMSAPTPKITRNASSTAAMTEGTRPRCHRRSSATSGPSAKLRRTANASGTKTSRAKYSAAIAMTPTAKIPSGDDGVPTG